MTSLLPDIFADDGNTTVNMTIWEYLENTRGPQQLPSEIAVPLTIVNLAIFITGLAGNIAICSVIIQHPSLHTATNYYLFNLAVSDLALLIFGLPNDVTVYWHQYPWVLGENFCKIRALISEMASYVSVLTIVAFSTERYLAICYPLYLHTMSGLQRAIRIIACLWIFSFFSALPFAMHTVVDYLYFPPDSEIILEESAFCGMLSQPESLPLAEISTLLFFLVPMLIIVIQYTIMGLKISKTTQRLGKGVKGSVHRGSRKAQSNRTIIRMLAAVVIGFFICWAPFHAQRLWYIHGQYSPYYNEINAYIFYVTGILYYFSSTLNPVLYNLMSKRYRSAFKEVLCGIKKKHKLMRNSTFRETKQYSRSENARLTCVEDLETNGHNNLKIHLGSFRHKNVDDKLKFIEKDIFSEPAPALVQSYVSFKDTGVVENTSSCATSPEENETRI